VVGLESGGSEMTYLQIITAAAKAAHISVAVLYAVCAHESNDFMYDYTMYDNGSPSYSVCQLKKDTALLLGWDGKDEMELRNPYVGIKYAAKYLRYQLDRYNGDYCKAVAAYNSGSFIESKKNPGYPKNLKYVRKVQQRLEKSLQNKLSCDIKDRKFVDTLE
jgi:soluble lytic murein transglycosylase-like protein